MTNVINRINKLNEIRIDEFREQLKKCLRTDTSKGRPNL